MEKWFVMAKKADFEDWAAEYGISPILARIIRNRDITDKQEVRRYINGTLEDCHSPWLLKDMDRAVDTIETAIREGRAIRVVGDYDVDGICSAYILTAGLREMGAKVDAAIPHRIRDGYGLNDHLIEEAHEAGIELIVTCDNGIAAASQIALAREYGISVVVTDHHEVPYEETDGVRKQLLPPAEAIVDPKQEGCSYPFPGICGAVVAFKCILALAQRSGGDMQALQKMFLPFAALATVCDVMELKDENRILVKEGLKALATCENQGLRALIEVNGLSMDGINTYHLGFVLGPCLNATGRLDTAQRALTLLLTPERPRAVMIARELKDLNDSRKNLTLEGTQQAIELVTQQGREQDKVLVVYLPQVHESLAGIIAGKVRERYYRPTFVLTKGEEGVKGSGRSIEGYHMYDAMTQLKEYFTKYGGHKMAAGLSMKEEDIDNLRQALNDRCALSPEDYIPKVHIDMAMPFPYATMALARELSRLEPYGIGNQKPLFAQKDVLFKRVRLMGEKKNVARFSVQCGQDSYDLLYFGGMERFEDCLREKYGEGCYEAFLKGEQNVTLTVTYQLNINAYKGREEVQLVLQNFC